MAGFFLTVSPESILLVAEHAAAKNKARILIISYQSIVYINVALSPKSS